MTDKNFMQKAIDKAYEGIAKGQTPFGACIVKDGIVISCEHNIVWQSTDITAHAEITAIRAACKALKSIDLSGCIIYSTCEPCPMCFSAIHWANIKKIFYGTEIKDAEKIGFNELKISNEKMKNLGQSKIEIIKNFMYEENLKLFNDWRKQDTAKNY